MQASDEPMFAVTGDDSRYYEWPHMPGIHFPSITTISKGGIPNEILEKWKLGKAVELATEAVDTLLELREVERGADL